MHTTGLAICASAWHVLSAPIQGATVPLLAMLGCKVCGGALTVHVCYHHTASMQGTMAAAGVATTVFAVEWQRLQQALLAECACSHELSQLAVNLLHHRLSCPL